MQVDQVKFLNALLERSNQKLTQIQNQLLIAETQLALSLEQNKELEKELEKLRRRRDRTQIEDNNT